MSGEGYDGHRLHCFAIDGALFFRLASQSCGGDAIHVGHLAIHEHGVEGTPRKVIQSRRSTLGGDDLIAEAPKNPGRNIQVQGIVVCNKQPAARGLASGAGFTGFRRT
jgi:hypothetical protein